MTESAEHYIVERILDSRGAGKKKQYRILWQGYSEEESTWQPIQNLEYIKPMLDEFDREKAKNKPKKGRRAETCSINRDKSEHIQSISEINFLPESEQKVKLKRERSPAQVQGMKEKSNPKKKIRKALCSEPSLQESSPQRHFPSIRFNLGMPNLDPIQESEEDKRDKTFELAPQPSKQVISQNKQIGSIVQLVQSENKADQQQNKKISIVAEPLAVGNQALPTPSSQAIKCSQTVKMIIELPKPSVPPIQKSSTPLMQEPIAIIEENSIVQQVVPYKSRQVDIKEIRNIKRKPSDYFQKQKMAIVIEPQTGRHQTKAPTVNPRPIDPRFVTPQRKPCSGQQSQKSRDCCRFAVRDTSNVKLVPMKIRFVKEAKDQLKYIVSFTNNQMHVIGSKNMEKYWPHFFINYLEGQLRQNRKKKPQHAVPKYQKECNHRVDFN